MFRSGRAAWIARALLALALGSAAPAAGAAEVPDIRGVYVIANSYYLGDGELARAVAVPGVDGLLIHLFWNDIAPAKGAYTWTFLDAAVRLALAHGKSFELGIVTGGSTPSWVYGKPPAGLGGVARAFAFQNGGGGCQTLTMTAPYNPAYLAAFSDLLTQVSAHLKTVTAPGVATTGYAAMTMLKLTGMTTITDELRLPANVHAPCTGDPATMWQTLGYTPQKVQAAWAKMLQFYLAAFPDKSFDIGFIARGAFPGIDRAGKRGGSEAVAQSLSANLSFALISGAEHAMPGRVGLGFDSLALKGAASNDNEEIIFKQVSTAAGVLRGWQTNESLGEKTGGAACDTSGAVAKACAGPLAFQAMLLKGIYPNGVAATTPAQKGRYVEVFPANVNAFPAAILAVHKALVP